MLTDKKRKRIEYLYSVEGLTMREIARKVGVASPSTVHWHLQKNKVKQFNRKELEEKYLEAVKKAEELESQLSKVTKLVHSLSKS
jgi:transposase-like protein